jgi:hypothetical protein
VAEGEAMNAPSCLNHLAEQPRWVGWRWETVKGRRTKPPRTVLGGRANGHALNNDPTTWATLAEANAALAADGLDGVGLQLLDLEGFAAVDLDDVRDPETGSLLPWAADLIAKSGSYAELTPSGNGARILGKVPPGERLHQGKTKHPDGGSFEIYVNTATGRYITVTGDRLPGSPDALTDISGVVANLRGAKSGNLDDIDWTPKPPRFEDLPERLRTTISHGWTGDRSADFQAAVNSLAARVDFAQALKWFEEHPNGPASKYQGRLEAELRRSWAKAEDSGGEKPEPPKKSQAARLILNSAAFMAGFEPPDYVVDGILQRGKLYSLCGRPGAGKTLIMLLMQSCLARGLPFCGREADPGSTFFSAGENPQNVATQWIGLCADHFLAPDALSNVHWARGVFDMGAGMDQALAEASAIPDLRLVTIDSQQAFNPGDDENDNLQQQRFAKRLRGFADLPSRPAVVVICHPTKNAGRDNLRPRGGSGFFGEIDGNLCLWSEERGITELFPDPEKFRGAPFDPIKLEVVVTQPHGLVDAKGRQLPSVVARPMLRLREEAKAKETESRENAALRAIDSNPRISREAIGEQLGCGKTTAHRIVSRLLTLKWIRPDGRELVLTAQGRKVLDVAF